MCVDKLQLERVPQDLRQQTPTILQTERQKTLQPTSQSLERGGVAGVHGFWECGHPCVFDIRITDTNAQSYRNKDVDKVLKAHEERRMTST